MFVRRDGILRVEKSTALSPGILKDIESLRDALEARDGANVQTILSRMFEADHVIPFSVTTDYPALYSELINLSREYVDVSSLDTGEEGPRNPQKRPAWERLKLSQSDDGSDHTAELDGKRIRIRGDAAFKMLDTLQKKKGQRVKAIVLQKALRQRPDKVLKLLDARLQRIIEAPGKGCAGYAMR